jgi:putative transposase
MTPDRPSFAGYRFPAEIISHAVWLYFRFPLSLRMVEELLAARGIAVSYETIRQWALKFGQASPIGSGEACFARATSGTSTRSPSRSPGCSTGSGAPSTRVGRVLDVLVQRRRDTHAAKRLLRKLLKRQGRPPRVLITDKLGSCSAAERELMPDVEHRRHKGLNDRAKNSHQPTRRRERQMKRFMSARHA